MSTRPATILIVDDDKTVIEQLVTFFRRRGYEPIATANSKIVEQTFDAFEVHLLLLDLRMEALDGYKVLDALKAKGIRVPFLIITAYYQSEKERLKDRGIEFEDVIQKPFPRDFGVIETKINRKLNRLAVPGEVGSDYEDKIYLSNRTRLVLVDDETEMNEMLKEILEARNYEVKVFSKGDEALDYILKNECHVAVVDMKVPGLGGDEIIREALKAKPNLKVIPISGAYAAEIRLLLSRVGFDPLKLVTKPFDLPMLLEQIKVLANEAGTLGSGS